MLTSFFLGERGTTFELLNRNHGERKGANHMFATDSICLYLLGNVLTKFKISMKT